MIEIWWLYHVTAVLVGLVIGSFANVAILRLPDDRSLLPGSACPRCGAAVRPRDNIPVLSWVILRGRCRDCAAPIPPTYPLVELLGGLLAFLVWRRFVPGPAELDAAHLVAAALYFALVMDLVIAAYADVRRRIIPDQTSSWAVPVAILGVVALGALGYDGPLAMGWRASVVGAAAAGGALGAIAWVAGWLSGGEALGWGDVKLFALIGAALGAIPGAFLVLLIASLTGAAGGLVGIAVVRRRIWLPFGPSLAFGGIVYVLWGDSLARAFVPGLALLAGGR